MSDSIRTTGRVATGIPGLDEVLHGGVPRGSLVLVEGRPGSGKTTFGLQCLIHGAAIGETCLFVTNAESPSQLEAIAASHEWDLTGVHMFEWAESPGASDAEPAEYTLFPEDEVEVGESLQRLFAEMDRVKPSLLVIDTLSSLRGLAPTQAYHRRQMRRLRKALLRTGCTGVLLDDSARDEKGARSRTLADALIELKQIDVNYGADRRRLRVRKVRGSTYVSGAHDFSIVTGGLVVYPRLIAGKHESVSNGEPLASGNAALDALSGGGLPRGSSTLIMGPAGIGKSTLATSYAVAAAAKGERCLVLLFDEAVSTFLARSRGLGLEVAALSSSGQLRYAHLDPAERSPGEISRYLLEQVEREGVSVVVIDTLNGYLHSAVSEPDVLLHLRELISYLGRKGVVTLMTLTQHGVLGPDSSAPADISFLADNVFLMRYFEAQGSIRQALSMVKKRTGPHERTVRELAMSAEGLRLSQPLREFEGVLSGNPSYVGDQPLKRP